NRNMRSEAARIARREILDASEVDLTKIDALVFPGGYGVSLNLSSYTHRKRDAEIHPRVQALILDAHRLRKPIGGICIATALLGMAFRGTTSVQICSGDSSALHEDLRSWGMTPIACGIEDAVVDRGNCVVTTPAYIFDRNMADVFVGIQKLAREIVALC